MTLWQVIAAIFLIFAGAVGLAFVDYLRRLKKQFEAEEQAEYKRLMLIWSQKEEKQDAFT